HLVSRGSEASNAFDFKSIQDTHQWINASACLAEPALDEGNMEEIALDKTAKAKLFKRRYVKVSRDNPAPSFQQFGCLAMTPQAGFVLPGSECINHAAGLAEDIDFCIRIKTTPAAQAKQRNAKTELNLTDHKEHPTGDRASTGGQSDLDKSAVALREYVTALNATDREVEVEDTIIFAASALTAEHGKQNMTDVAEFY